MPRSPVTATGSCSSRTRLTSCQHRCPAAACSSPTMANGQTRRLTPLFLPAVGSVPAHVEGVAVSRNGTRVVFVTDSPLVPEDQDASYDLMPGPKAAMRCACSAPMRTASRWSVRSMWPRRHCRPTGRYASFTMRTVDSIPDEGGVFVRDLEQPVLDRVWGPTWVALMSLAALSADARYVAFSTSRSDRAGRYERRVGCLSVRSRDARRRAGQRRHGRRAGQWQQYACDDFGRRPLRRVSVVGNQLPGRCLRHEPVPPRPRRGGDDAT